MTNPEQVCSCEFHGECPVCTTGQATPDTDTLARLRILRAWHYRALVKSRQLAHTAVSATMAMRYHEEANVHLGFVQSLNDFFQPDDTAERGA